VDELQVGPVGGFDWATVFQILFSSLFVAVVLVGFALLYRIHAGVQRIAKTLDRMAQHETIDG